MKLNQYSKLIIPGLLSFALFACSDDNEPYGIPGTDENPSELTLQLAVPDFTVETLASRAEAPTLTSLTVLCYDGTNSVTPLSSTRLTSGWKTSGNNIEVTIPIHSKTVNLQLVANSPESVSLVGDLSTQYISNASDGVLWGQAALKDVLATPASSRSIAMVRANAKVSAQSSASNFTITGIGVFGTAESGSIAPAGLNPSSSVPNVKSGEAYGFSSGIKSAGSEIAIFETPKEGADANPHSRIIVRGTYNGVDGYYPVAFRIRRGSGSSEIVGNYTYEPVDVLRNHHYKVNVTAVRAQGFRSYEEACKAEPDNRMTVLITDSDESVTSIIAGRDYELGVSEYVDAPNNNATGNPTVKITVISSRPEVAGEERIILADNASWIKTEGLKNLTPTSVVPMKSSKNANGYRYEIDVPLDINNNADAREGKITVRSGELTAQITVRQAGTDYLRDPARPVQFSIDNRSITTDYFSWVTSTLQGATSDAFYQNGVRRDDGLNFPAVPAYTAVYYIKVLDGDKSFTVTPESLFTVVNNGTNYVVSMKTQSSPGIMQGELTIVNKDGVTIKYPLYRTGYIHELTSASTSYQMEEAPRTGWFYYEVVYCGTQWTTDRNLGADSGLPFITTSAALKKNIGATGAYFKISDTKATSANNLVTSKLSLSRWTVPEQADLSAMNIKITDITPVGAERTHVAAAVTSNGSKLSQVFIPHYGYYEATSLKLETHAILWTKSLVSGNQGFSSTSPEYGYWLQYFDAYNTSVGFSNMRLANGSSGQVPTETSVFKYLPIRPVWK